MKIVVSGSRGLMDTEGIRELLDLYRRDFTELVSGACPNSPDQIAEAWARAYEIPITRFPADWKKHGRSAGMIRNRTMAEYADGLIAFWDGKSRGTAHMISCAKSEGLAIVVAIPPREPRAHR